MIYLQGCSKDIECIYILGQLILFMSTVVSDAGNMAPKTAGVLLVD